MRKQHAQPANSWAGAMSAAAVKSRLKQARMIVAAHRAIGQKEVPKPPRQPLGRTLFQAVLRDDRGPGLLLRLKVRQAFGLGKNTDVVVIQGAQPAYNLAGQLFVGRDTLMEDTRFQQLLCALEMEILMKRGGQIGAL